jgi:hypothetical protein
MVTSRGQVELNETLLVLFIIVVIILLGIFFYFRFSLARVDTIADALQEQKGTVLLARAHRLQELRCSQYDCLDTSKFIPFQESAQREWDYYTSVLGTSSLRIEQLYPSRGQGDCSLATYTHAFYPENCGTWIVYDHRPSVVKQKIVMSKVVSLYFPELREYRLGRLEVVSYA